jgi:hypothetical protein
MLRLTPALVLIGADNNTTDPDRLETINHLEVTQAGWYTPSTFYDNGGVLAVDMQVLRE